MPNEVDLKEAVVMLTIDLKNEWRLCKAFQADLEAARKEIERLKQAVINLGGRP